MSAQSLDQILKGVLLPAKSDGSRSPRKLGDAAAHKIEDAYKLGRGWFDVDDRVSTDAPTSPRLQLLGYFDELPPIEQLALVEHARSHAARVIGDRILAEKFNRRGGEDRRSQNLGPPEGQQERRNQLLNPSGRRDRRAA